jgi:hypothetical protein
MLALFWVISIFFAFKHGKKSTSKAGNVNNVSLEEGFMKV